MPRLAKPNLAGPKPYHAKNDSDQDLVLALDTRYSALGD